MVENDSVSCSEEVGHGVAVVSSALIRMDNITGDELLLIMW